MAAAVALGVDQISKAIIRVYLPKGESASLGFIRITQVNNARSAFGLIPASPWPFFAASIVIFFLLLLALWRWGGPGNRVFQVGMGLIAAGAIGNIIDRIALGSVVDFIDVGFWPVFNVADIAIVIGVIIALAFVAIRTWKPEEENA